MNEVWKRCERRGECCSPSECILQPKEAARKRRVVSAKSVSYDEWDPEDVGSEVYSLED